MQEMNGITSFLGHSINDAIPELCVRQTNDGVSVMSVIAVDFGP